ncbi:hypothetical protein [Herbaspirillum rubrisubalbicans]|nr:hypothetical protein [Herbaspirillum rubrisubalbicans]
MHTYAKNKSRGGSAGKKGSRYEDFFMAYQAAKLAATLLKARVPVDEWPIVSSQILGFVDDVTIEANDKSEFFQLKNVADITWHGGKHPIEVDFASQYVLANKLGQPNPQTGLVVPTEALSDKLKETIPQSIKSHSAVHLFEDRSVANRYVLEDKVLQGVLAELAPTQNPKLDELVGVFAIVILAVSVMTEKGGRLSDLLEATRKICPHQLRALVADMEQYVKPEFRAVLDAVEGLTYSLDRGFFQWNGFGTTGVYGVVCSHPDFEKFQELIIRKHPKTFDDFEGLM